MGILRSMAEESPKSLTIAISGCTSSGKTTLTALLRLLLPADTVFLHADAFGRPFEEMPVHEDGFADCDSRQSLRFDDLEVAIDFARATGRTPDTYRPFAALGEDLDRATKAIEPGFLDSLRDSTEALSAKLSQYKTIVVVDGFLLFHAESLKKRFDVKILLRASREESWRRRSRRYDNDLRSGGGKVFWQTEPYFDSCVWPNYALEHAYLFPDGDVAAGVDSRVTRAEYGILVQPVPNLSIHDAGRWALNAILEEISNF